MIRSEPGWMGMFSRDQAPGAIANGSRIVKTWDERGDTHKVGSLGTVLGSIAADEATAKIAPGVQFFYFVEWDAHPRMAVGVNSKKIAAVNS